MAAAHSRSRYCRYCRNYRYHVTHAAVTAVTAITTVTTLLTQSLLRQPSACAAALMTPRTPPSHSHASTARVVAVTWLSRGCYKTEAWLFHGGSLLFPRLFTTVAGVEDGGAEQRGRRPDPRPLPKHASAAPPALRRSLSRPAQDVEPPHEDHRKQEGDPGQPESALELRSVVWWRECNLESWDARALRSRSGKHLWTPPAAE